MLPNTRTATNFVARPTRVVALVIALALTACGHSSSAVGIPARSLPGYRIVYRIEVHAPDVEVTRREVTVRRPDQSSDLTFADGGTTPISGFVSQGTRLYSIENGGVVDHGDRPSGSAPGDDRLGAVMSDLVRLKLARRVGTARVAGRPCVLYRLAGPLGDPIKPIKAGEHADECIDRAGLVLSERWELRGRLVRLTEAQQVDVATPAADAFQPPALPRHATPTGFTEVQSLPTTRAPATGLPYWVAASPPWGFRLLRRVRAATTAMTPDGPQIADLEYVDTYARGADVITVAHREQSLGSLPAGSEHVRAGRLGVGTVTFSSAGADLAFAAGKWVVTVEGPFDAEHLRVFAARLAPR